MKNKIIYLDNAATTKVDNDVAQTILTYFTENYGNASSLHDKGTQAKQALDEAKKTIAQSINAKPHEIVFTSGGSEANNHTLKGTVSANPNKNHIITTEIEHDSILNCCKYLEKQGINVTYLKPDNQGFISSDNLKKAITSSTLLVSIIHGNNEIGTIQNLEQLGKICKENNILFHTDACQSYTKTELDVKKQNLDLVSLNAHKIYGPKGIGALYIKEGTKIQPLIHGGGQEAGKRSGTENIPGIVGFAQAVKLDPKTNQIQQLRDYAIEELKKIPNSKLNGPEDNRLCNNLNFSFTGAEGESIILYLNDQGICCSTGSACSSKSLTPSHVLRAIGLSPQQAHSSVRISLSKDTTKQEIDKTIKALTSTIEKLREMAP